MAEAAVEFLLGKLNQLLLYQLRLIDHQKHEVKELQENFQVVKALLKDVSEGQMRNEELVYNQIQDVAYEAEDTIDTLVSQATEAKSQNYFKRAFKKQVDFRGIIQKLHSIVDTLQRGRDSFLAMEHTSSDDEFPANQVIRENNVVGFDDEAKEIIEYLIDYTTQPDVISIVGMPGLGKTTLAGKIFCDKQIQYEFPERIWVYVSQEFKIKEIYLSMLKKFTRMTKDMLQKTDDELAKTVCAYLEKEKSLIVMDDVWSQEDWNRILVALPLKVNHACKVLITTRHLDVAQHASRNRKPHCLRFLNQDESWLLLRYEFFGRCESPEELEVLGYQIAQKCYGLPLAIVLIGGILLKVSANDDVIALKKSWIKISENMIEYLYDRDRERRLERIIALSYNHLPYHLRACFLYLAMFPKDYEIPVWKLVNMWIAEGFIQPGEDGISLEETAEGYLHELINRNLVRVGKRRYDGRAKTCRMLDLLRGFCIKEAGTRKYFFQEIKRTPKELDYSFLWDVEKCRRICIHSNVLHFIRLKPSAPKVRSLVCFSKEEIIVPSEDISVIPKASKLFRVLDIEPLKFSNIPFEMYQLVHLRYLILSFDHNVLPEAFAKLWNLETFVVYTSSRTLDIKADISRMTQLKHLKTNKLATLPKAEKINQGDEKLQTLGIISPQSFTEEMFDRCCNLKKLGICGKLALLSFDRLAKLYNLKKLKLLNDAFPCPPSESPLPQLPPPYQFPPKLKSLTLSATFLDWTNMEVLGLLESLKVLRIKDRAFCGQSWVATDGGFRQLEFLHIGRTDLIQWEASHHHYPRLKRLELHYCEKLTEVPISLADIPSFLNLELRHSNTSVFAAKKILEAKQKKDINYGEFKLSIFPPLPSQTMAPQRCEFTTKSTNMLD